jgi:methionyl-tRNA synthetase
MSEWQDQLIQQIDENPDWIVPEVRRNEIMGFLRQPLGDLSISRPKSRLSWGIDLPFDSDHVAYVWVDALINYLTASGAIDPSKALGEQGFDDVTDSWWPADMHLVGNVVDPLALRETFGTDAVRWYLMREMPTGGDASYTPERFLIRYEELANVLGNLASRATSMIVKYRDGVIPDGPSSGLDRAIEQTLQEARSSVEHLKVHEAFAAAMDLARAANVYVEERQPWAQAKDPSLGPELDETLATLARVLGVLCALFQPVTPEKMGVLATRLGLSGVPTLNDALAKQPSGRRVTVGEPLFPRVVPAQAAASD